MALAGSDLSAAWLHRDLVAAQDLRTIGQWFRSRSTRRASHSAAPAALAADKLRSLANRLLLATARPDQRYRLRRATGDRGPGVDWACPARAPAAVCLVAGCSLLCNYNR